MNIYGFPCTVTADLNHHLAQHDEDEYQQEAIDSKQQTLLAAGGECYPFSNDNLSEAIGEIDIENIVASLKSGKHEAVGKALAEWAEIYWERQAQRKAEREIENNSDGSRHCNEN